MSEVIRYGAGGKPYRGKVGLHSTDVEATPVEPKVETAQVEMNFVEDDTPLSDEQVITKTKGKKKK
jgi:hypothetical protein